MALDLKIKYGGQVDHSDPNYPYGKAKNVSAPGAGNGTPWEQALVNDLLGLQQALLIEAGLTPNGTPDHANASQYLDALRIIHALELPLDPAFLSATFAWAGYHTFALAVDFLGLINANGGIATSTISASGQINSSSNVIAGGDVTCTGHLASAAHCVINNAAGYLGIANCANTNGGFLFTGTKPARNLTYAAAGGHAYSGWKPIAGGPWGGVSIPVAPSTSDVYVRQIVPPNEAVVSSMTARFGQPSAATTNMLVELIREDIATGAVTVMGSIGPSAYGTETRSDLSITNPTIDNTSYLYFFRATGCSSDAPSCSFQWGKLFFGDPGPRNY